MSNMGDNSRLFIGTAFVAGVLFTVGFNQFLYPKVELRLRQHGFKGPKDSSQATPSEALVARPGPPAIVDGIEGCIGNTPLFRIKSLSEETGCEILAKAEVRTSLILYPGRIVTNNAVLERRRTEL